MSVDLHLGDCLDVLPMIPDGSVDMVLADPPYGTTACSWDSAIPLEPMWEQLKRVIKPKGAIVMTASQPFTTALIASNMNMFKYCWVWEKNKGSNFAATRYQPMREHEDIAVFCAGSPSYYPVLEPRSPAGISILKGGGVQLYGGKSDAYNIVRQPGDQSHLNPTMRGPRSVQRFKCERGLHPTQKPVALMDYLIRTYTLEGETVLDFTMGSGTTGVACANTGRKFIGIEKEVKYFDIAKARLAQMVIA